MKLYINDFMFCLSEALDGIEEELIGSTTFHSKRVAYMSFLMGKELGINGEELVDLSFAAAMHDNALTEYLSAERKNTKIITKENIVIGDHCLMGEKNMEKTPFYMKGTILYHHENEDGSGPFKLKGKDIPLTAMIIHLADIVDVSFALDNVDSNKYEAIKNFLHNQTNKMFSSQVVQTFLSCFTLKKMQELQHDKLDGHLKNDVPMFQKEISLDEIKNISNLFAHIIDYKSHFTSTHSLGIAEKAEKLAKYYNFSKEKQDIMYIAGALHDVGKLLTDTEILEKPDKLNYEEYENIKNHALGTYMILKDIRGFDDITAIASSHHEKLDGSGYPFGRKADDLTLEERMLGCIDIYQALCETRPYKKALPHEKACEILQDMAKSGKIDGSVVNNIQKCFA